MFSGDRIEKMLSRDGIEKMLSRDCIEKNAFKRLYRENAFNDSDTKTLTLLPFLLAVLKTLVLRRKLPSSNSRRKIYYLHKAKTKQKNGLASKIY